MAVVVAVLWCASPASAQEATERFIPIGQSPGVSGYYSYIGEVEQVDAQNRTITVRGPEGSRTIAVTERTKIWLDRSALRQSNLSGTFADVQTGRRIEVKYEDYERKENAYWIKVAVPAGG
jgi:hypothetical protein